MNSAHVNKVIFKDRKLYIATDKGMNTYYNNFIGNIPNTGLPDSNITYLTIINNTIYSVIANRVYYLENNMWNIYTPLSGHSIEFIEGKTVRLSLQIPVRFIKWILQKRFEWKSHYYKYNTYNIDK